jgi:predicted amidohydrolase
MKIAVVQHEIVWEEPEANFAALRAPIDEAAETGAGLIVLTETFSWGFTMNTDRASEAPDGMSTQFLHEQSSRTGAWVVGSIPVRESGSDRPHNRMTFAGPAGELHAYNKRHPFTYSGETDAYCAGGTTQTLMIGDLRITPFVCFDLRFADDFWNVARETDCYLGIANWPATRRHHRTSLLTARAIENQAWVVASNRVGADPNVTYAGDSRIIDPFGELVADLPDVAGVIHADVTPARVNEVRTEFPFLADRT